MRAFELTTQFSQSAEGFWFFEVRTSTTSPVFSFSRIETAFPPMRAPVQRQPTFVWMLNAKSSTVEPALRMRSSPVGVKTNISSDGAMGLSSGFASVGCSRA